MIIPLKMQSMFVNINFPEPKGASQLVCHLFIGPESCTLKPNRPLSDPLGKVFQLQPLTCIDLYYPENNTVWSTICLQINIWIAMLTIF